MSLPRIFQDIEIKVGSTIQLDEQASHHLGRVLRIKTGEHILIFNGQGGEYSAQVHSIEKNGMTVRIENFVASAAESPLKIHLGQGIARGEKMDFIIQKAVELGVSTITPLLTERCNVHLNNERMAKRQQHWQAVAISASEQCGRTQIVHIETPLPLDAWLNSIQEQTRFVLVPTAEQVLPRQLSSERSIAVLIGPEGGLSAEEVQNASKHNFHSVNLGPRILRTETASLVILSILQFEFGDLSDQR